MPRPRKCRKVCCLPHSMEFVPAGIGEVQDSSIIIMTVDEYETVRLIDHQGFSQEECGLYMKIARTTVQQMYNDARKKMACALVEGRPLRIQGGNYKLCDGHEDSCKCGGCRRHRMQDEAKNEQSSVKL